MKKHRLVFIGMILFLFSLSFLLLIFLFDYSLCSLVSNCLVAIVGGCIVAVPSGLMILFIEHNTLSNQLNSILKSAQELFKWPVSNHSEYEYIVFIQKKTDKLFNSLHSCLQGVVFIKRNLYMRFKDSLFDYEYTISGLANDYYSLRQEEKIKVIKSVEEQRRSCLNRINDILK